MFIVREEVSITTNSSGVGTGSTKAVNGRILSIQYVKTDFATGVDFTITTSETSRGVWAESDVNASAIRAPRQACHSILGAALNYNDESNEPVVDYINVANESIDIAVASGGSGKVGTFYVEIEGS